MTTRYVSNKTTPLLKNTTDESREMVLIFGDEVETLRAPAGGKVYVDFRGRKGYVNENHLSSNPSLEMYFIDVGQGDSIFIVTPQRKKILIDGGINRRAMGFLAWKYRLDIPTSPVVDIDLLVLSHADGDHIDGLVPIINHPKIKVQKIIHNGIAVFNEGAFATTLGDKDTSKEFLTTRYDGINDLNGLNLSDSFRKWEQGILNKGIACKAVNSTTGALNAGDPDVSIDILGPRLDICQGSPAYQWLGGVAETINGHSVIMSLKYGQVTTLLAGDINSDGAKNLLKDPVIAGKLNAHVFKSPHHGSHDYYRPFLEAINPQISVISSGDDPDHGHPRASFIGMIGQVSRSKNPLVFSTEIAATFVEAGVREGTADLEEAILMNSSSDSLARMLFKRRLHGMINVRTDGKKLYAARRVAAGYWWESYGPLTLA